MASLIAAQGTGTGFVGVAPEAKVLPIVAKSVNATAAGIRYATDHGAKVINVSRGAVTECPPNIQESVGYAIEHDVVVVAAAGNDGDETNSSEAPADCAGVLAVGAVDSKFRPWVKTQRKSYVAVAAPGVQVGGVLKDGQVHSSNGGTSGATALTSAVIALVRAKFPDMSARQVVQQIIASAGDVGSKGKDDQTGYGLIRPTRILNGTVPKNGPNPVFAAYDKWKAANAKQTGAAGSGSDTGSSPSSTDYLLVGGFAALVVAIVIVVLVMQGRKRRRLQAASTGRYGAGPGGPQAYGGPYPPQGGQPPAPGGQQPYYPPAGPQGGSPPQGRHPNPPGQWGAG
jgi:hypothetical protein